MGPANTISARMEQAGLWWARLREPDLAPEIVTQWLDWCQRDPANLEAFEKIEALGSGLAKLDAATRGELARELLDEAEPAAAPPRRSAWRAAGRYAAAAGLAAAIVFAGTALFDRPGWGPSPSVAYVTPRAQMRDVDLDDGSHLAIGADSSVKVDYSAALRSLQLGSGEAYFEVAHNPDRPFVVHAGRLKVTAVGTAFNIRKTGDKIEVMVVRGAVDVEDLAAASAGQQPADRLRLVAGQLAVANAGDPVLTVRPADGLAAVSWRSGNLAFDNDELSLVVANVNRYSPNEVILADPALRRLRFTGTVVQGREDEWIAAIQQVFPIASQRDDRGRILLYRRSAARADANSG